MWLDGLDISHGLQSLTLYWKSDEVTMAELTIGIGEVDMDAQTLAHLTAVVERQQEASAK